MFIVSRRSLTRDINEWPNICSFHMWAKQLWPYLEVKNGDRVFWYEGESKTLVWETRIVQLEAFAYDSSSQAYERLDRTFGPIDRKQPYVDRKDREGYCLAFRSEPVRVLDVPAPDGFRMPMLGWMRITPEVNGTWGGIF